MYSPKIDIENNNEPVVVIGATKPLFIVEPVIKELLDVDIDVTVPMFSAANIVSTIVLTL